MVWRFSNPIWKLDLGSVPAITALPILVGLTKSDDMKMYCRDPELFLVYATNSDTSGWTITRCQVLEEGGEQYVVGSPTVPPKLIMKMPRSPYKAIMIVPLITKTITETPMASNKVLHQILEAYGKPSCFTETIIGGEDGST